MEERGSLYLQWVLDNYLLAYLLLEDRTSIKNEAYEEFALI